MKTTAEADRRTRIDQGWKMQSVSGCGRRSTALFIAAVTLLVGGCAGGSQDGHKEESGAGVAASSLCDGTFDAPAAKALQRLAGTSRFDEGSGTSEAGEPRMFSLRNAVQHLHDEYRKRSACWVYKTGDDSGDALLEIRFSASTSHPSATQKESSSDQTTFPLGVYANAGPDGADPFFRCITRAPSKDAYIGDTKYVKAELYSTAAMRGDSPDKDRMVILNSISRKFAHEAGCASEAGVPAVVTSAGMRTSKGR